MTKEVKQQNLTYNDSVTVTCSCGAKYIVGSTVSELAVEICAACHPFYTGNQKFIDSSGRLEHFKARVAAGQVGKEEKQKREAAKAAKKKEAKDLKEGKE